MLAFFAHPSGPGGTTVAIVESKDGKLDSQKVQTTDPPNLQSTLRIEISYVTTALSLFCRRSNVPMEGVFTSALDIRLLLQQCCSRTTQNQRILEEQLVSAEESAH